MTDLEQALLELLREERERVDFLIECLVKQQGAASETVTVIPKSKERRTWGDIKSRLERKHAKTRQGIGAQESGTGERSVSDESTRDNNSERSAGTDGHEKTTEVFGQPEESEISGQTGTLDPYVAKFNI